MPLNSKDLEKLLAVVQDLSLARNMTDLMAITRTAARQLTGADGATFVLRDGDNCYYADEDAIEPLWKGKHFPMQSCVSGWVMKSGKPLIISDIYQDSRILMEAYSPTFVKSVAMVPIRSRQPIGAIGNYWAKPHEATESEMRLLQALADSTSVAMENIQLYEGMDRRVKERTADIEAFSYSASHDLRSPLSRIIGLSQALGEDYGAKLDAIGKMYVDKIEKSSEQMLSLVDNLLRLFQLSSLPLDNKRVDLSQMAEGIFGDLRSENPLRRIDTLVAPDLLTDGDEGLLRVALENLIRNAWKFTAHTESPKIVVGKADKRNGKNVYFVGDNGAGFDTTKAEKVFQPFQRFHASEDFAGTGVGLATVQRVISRHGGDIWPESAPGQGARFYFTLSSGGH